MVEKISASYFTMPGIWTLYSINLINHEPPWRRVDHTVTFLRQYISHVTPRFIWGHENRTPCSTAYYHGGIFERMDVFDKNGLESNVFLENGRFLTKNGHESISFFMKKSEAHPIDSFFGP